MKGLLGWRCSRMTTAVPKLRSETIRTLPDDNVRQILWRFADRYDLQMLVQSAREVARGPVARLVAEGARASHEWSEKKAALLEAFDQSGITAIFMDPEEGGFLIGPKNLALALTAFELAWVDAGAATCSLAGCLALAPIHERGTAEQRTRYMSLAAPPAAGEDRTAWRGAFCLTEPIPYVGVDTGILGGKLRIAKWEEGQEPLLQLEKRGRFITNMGFANFVTAAVDSDDERIKSSCIVIVEQGDPGTFDRGAATRKLVHQLSSTGEPNRRRLYDQGRGDCPKLQPQRGHRSGFQAHARDGCADDLGQAAFGGRAHYSLSARTFPGIRAGEARKPPLRTGNSAAPGCIASSCRSLGDGRGRRVA